jgi:phosphoglycerate dehydrogenase-like enzyme
MVRVVVSQSLPAVATDYLRQLLGADFDVVELGGRPQEELLAALTTAESMIGQTFTPAMGQAGANLKLVQAQGAGTDGIDRAALPAGCYVANCYEHDISIAEFIIGCALAATRDIVLFDRNLRASGDFSPSGFYGGIPRRELRGRSLGIVGYGRIGRETARLARALGMSVLATKSRPDPALAAEDGLAWLGGADELDYLLAHADYVAVCAPLTDATRGLIGAAQFARMKPDAYLINIARGPVVDEEALYAALRDKRIAGAAIDVWYNYPPTGQGRPGNFPFEELDNLIMTPHVAGWTEGTVARRVEVMADNIRRVAAGEPPRNLVAIGA